MKKNNFIRTTLFFICALSLLCLNIPALFSASSDILVIQLNQDSINPVTAEYIIKNIDRAEADQAEVLILQLDTPGGLLNSTRTIVKRMLTAEVPIVVYIAPSGSRAGSAGVFITYASHIAAMAPSTNIGAAHPVQLGDRAPQKGNQWQDLQELLEELKKANMQKEDSAEQSESNDGLKSENVANDESFVSDDDPMGSKILNDTVAFIKAIAAQRNRNVDWAVESVTKSSSITVDEALEKGVVEIVAQDLSDLVKQLDGQSVQINGKEVILQTKEAVIQHVPMTNRQKFFNILADPNIAYFLMILGFYGLLFEITHPGIGVPGVLGAVFLILAFYSMQTLPTNYAGLALLALGLILLIAEAYTPTFGLLTLGGLVCMVLGSLLLFETADPVMRVSKFLIFSFAGMSALFSIVVLGVLIKNRRKPAFGAGSGMVGLKGEVQKTIEPNKAGKVFIHGELWNAESDTVLSKGDKVIVKVVEGMTLKVEAYPKD
jgi:membrane-bound serine protease (ClpP class)